MKLTDALGLYDIEGVDGLSISHWLDSLSHIVSILSLLVGV